MRLGRLLAAAVAGGCAALIPASSAAAHPLGNFTVNQHTSLIVARQTIDVEAVVDMAEIPAFQTRRQIDTNGDQQVRRDEAEAYRTQTCMTLVDGIVLLVDGRPLELRNSGGTLTFPPGQAGLPTLRLACGFRADVAGPLRGARLELHNRNYEDRVGWREMVATGRGLQLAESNVPSRSASRILTAYPEDLLSSPLDVRHARMVVGDATPGTLAGSGDAPPTEEELRRPLPRGADRFAAAFTNLVARQELTVGFALLALAAAISLGALHALAPGHGKTVIAAYLVGERGSWRDAAVLGLSVTTTHTAGVLLLGLLLSGSTAFVPERLYPWLGLTSGAMLTAIGIGLLRRAWRRQGAGLLDHHHHGRGHSHHRPGHVHGHSHGSDDHHVHPPSLSRKALVAMGAVGGLVPSPSALVVLLGAIALGRTWFGIALVLGYGVGMTLTLVGAGLILVRARASFEGRLAGGSRWLAVGRALPVATATLVVVAGVGLAAQAVTQV